MTDLITIDELTTQTNSSRIHVAYLTKLGILPNAVKRKLNGKLVGCYPRDSIGKIIEIKNLKDRGMTYSQIAKTHSTSASLRGVRWPSDDEAISKQIAASFAPLSPRNDIAIHLKPSNFAYLTLGLVIGVLVSALNTSGLAAMTATESLPLESDIYLIGVDKHNLDKLDKTNINYLIKN